jgi:hypothetical protein
MARRPATSVPSAAAPMSEPRCEAPRLRVRSRYGSTRQPVSNRGRVPLWCGDVILKQFNWLWLAACVLATVSVVSGGLYDSPTDREVVTYLGAENFDTVVRNQGAAGNTEGRCVHIAILTCTHPRKRIFFLSCDEQHSKDARG